MIISKIQEPCIYIFLMFHVPNKSFGQLLDILPMNFIFLKLFTQNFHVLKYGLQIKILNH